jgi:hypothetical protein
VDGVALRVPVGGDADLPPSLVDLGVTEPAQQNT